jgi:hypothetical protein
MKMIDDMQVYGSQRGDDDYPENQLEANGPMGQSTKLLVDNFF